MRRQRISVSCTVKVSAWPMCRLPVTFGGGIMMVKGVALEFGSQANAPALLPAFIQAGLDLGRGE